MKATLAVCALCACVPLLAAGLFAGDKDKDKPQASYELAFTEAQTALAAGHLDDAHERIGHLLEYDPKATAAWELRARWAEAKQDKDELVYALHQELRLATAQKHPAAELEALRTRLLTVDPLANDQFGFCSDYIAKLKPLAEQYEKDKRPHSAIRVHKEILALDPELKSSADAIERLAAARDSSLAADAKPKDLLADVSEEWIRAHDAKHLKWEDRAKLERENYVTYTNGGYATLVRAAEAMEQMSSFYREFFGYGTPDDGHSVPRIDLRIFRTRAEYLKHGEGPPAEWTGGHFTGGAVETYLGEGGFTEMVGTLFHESAHQFVSLATNASGWLNEGLASFFEGTRMLQNGTVEMNLPATGRLFPLVDRMKKGWMRDEDDGINPDKPTDSQPPKAPTFRIVLEDKYEWGPPWYAPTWGVVYFLYNYQDPVDGRYVYRAAFRTFISKSGGRAGEGAVKNFEEVVLANPQPPIKGVVRPAGALDLKLPKTVEELDPVWKEWMLHLADEVNGVIEVARPHLLWARNAVKNKDVDVAREHFEKGLVATPDDPDLLLEFAAFLADRKNNDRASKLGLQALASIEAHDPVDQAQLAKAEKLLEKWDPRRKALDSVHEELWAAAKSLVQRYQAAGMPMMVMDLSSRLGNELHMSELFDNYTEAFKSSGKSLAIWNRAYNERNLDGWAASGGGTYTSNGQYIDAHFGGAENAFDFRMLELDTVTSGDYSLEAEVLAERGLVTFCGLLFGKKDAINFHALVLFPGKLQMESAAAGVSGSAFVDLASSYGDKTFKTWRHNPVGGRGVDKDKTAVAGQHTLRIDVSGRIVDTWFDGQFLSTQEFPSVDVLRGNFGLICGPGKAKFSNLRYLARAPHDPAARIERAIRIDEIEKQGGGSLGGSYLGRRAPWPLIGKWVQGERKSWDEKGPVPQLLVLWSIQQNDIVRIDEWVHDLAQQYGALGLEIVSIASPNDADRIEGYLGAHPFPGCVAVDQRKGVGIGDSFMMYSVDRFNLPRLLLIDIDQRVVWEGDPGFRSGEPWAAGGESFLDTPLNDLIEKRRLKELALWMAQWKEKAQGALAQGDVATALPVLRDAKSFPKGVVSAIDEARRKLDQLEGTLDAAAATASSLARDGAEPALPTLLAWSTALHKGPDKAVVAAFKLGMESKSAKDWPEVLKQAEKVRVHKASERMQVAGDFVGRLANYAGRFPRELGTDVQAAIDAKDMPRLQSLLAEAPQRPLRWLVKDFLRW